MTETCAHRRRFTTPLAVLLGAVLVSGTSAYAAAQITGAQIADSTVTGADIANGSLGPADLRTGSVGAGAVRDGTLGAADLAPGVANRLTSVRTAQAQSADLSSANLSWQWALPTNELLTLVVTAQQRLTAQGVVGYQVGAAGTWDVAVCSSANGGPVTYAGQTYGSITVPASGRFNVPVQAEALVSSATLRVGPCLRGGNTASFLPDVSSVTVLLTNP